MSISFILTFLAGSRAQLTSNAWMLGLGFILLCGAVLLFNASRASIRGKFFSYIYSDEDGTEHVYNHRRGEFGIENPLSRAIQEKKLSKEKALTFALNEEGRVWIESNFMELSDLK